MAITLVSYKIDIFYEKNCSSRKYYNRKNAKLENLEKSINSNKFVLKDIEIILLYEDNEIDHLETIHIEKTVKEKYSILLGTEVKSIDPDIITLVVDKRILKMNGKEIQLHVNKLKLTEVLKLWIEADVFLTCNFLIDYN